MFCIANETINKTKRPPTKWEKIFVNNMSDKGQYPKYTKNPYNSTSRKHTMPLKKKNGQRTWTDIFLKKTYRWPTDTWQQTSFVIREMKINKTAIRYHHTMSEWLLSEKQQITSVDEDVEKREPSCVPGLNVNCHSYYRKQYRGS